MKNSFAISIGVLFGLSLAGGCGPGSSLSVKLEPQVARPARGVVLFICDGMSADRLEEGCRAGWLPNFEKRFVAGGTGVEHAITCVPSITYAVLTSFVTGMEPARHGVPANEWFDPRLRLWRKYAVIAHYRKVNSDFCQPTIYERLQPMVSLSIQNAVHRGATWNVANWAQSGVRWFFRDYTAVDKLTATTLEHVAGWANRHAIWPDFLVCYFPGLDSVGHARGVDSSEYREALEHLDFQVGRICDWLEAENLLGTTTLILVSDHGMAPTDAGGRVDLETILRRDMKRRVAARPHQDAPFEARDQHFRRLDTALTVSAERFAAIHFAGRLSWDHPVGFEELNRILEIPPCGKRFWDYPGVDLLAFRVDENTAEIRSPRGSARIEARVGEHGEEYRYVPEPNDPLGYLENAELAGFIATGFHAPREWLAATCGETYPDVVPRLLPLLRHPRTGQVVLFAARGYTFGREKSGHGGIHRDEMRIPMYFAGPGIPGGGRIPLAHATDLAPTILEWLRGEEDRAELDGRSLLGQLRQAMVTP